MVFGSNSKLKRATLGISGDPRFRLRSTIPPGGWILAVALGVATVVAGALIVLADGALARQERVVHANDCVNLVRALVDVRTHAYSGDERRSADASACLAGLGSFDEQGEALVTAIGGHLEALRAVHGKGERAEKDAVFHLEAALDDFYRWYIQNRARYGL